MTDFEERDYYSAPRRSNTRFDEPEYRPTRVMTRSPPPTRREESVDIRFRERESDRGPSFLREDARRAEAGPMVLRQRNVETWDRHHGRSPSPVRVREERMIRRPRSESPPQFHDHEHSRTRVVERERESIRSPSVARRRSPSPVVRFVERRRSPSPVREHIHTRIVEREKQREPSPSPSPSPPPVIRGPVIEREVITHYTDVDHGKVDRSCLRFA